MAAAFSENKKKSNLQTKYRVSDVTGMLHIATRSLEGFIYVSGFHLQTISQTWKGKHSFDYISLPSEPTSQANPQISSELSTVYWETGRRRRTPPRPACYWDTSSLQCKQKLKTIPTLIHQHPATFSYSTVIKFRFNSIPFKSSLWKWNLDFTCSH